MHTIHLPTVHVSVDATRCQYWWGQVGPQVNKFEQVFSDDHQMSVAGGGGSSSGLMLGEGGRSPGLMFRRVSYHVTYPMMHVTYQLIAPLWTDGCLWKHYLPATSFVDGNNTGVPPPGGHQHTILPSVPKKTAWNWKNLDQSFTK